MTIEEIKKIIEANKDSKKVFKITFKKRDALYGYFWNAMTPLACTVKTSGAL